MKVPSPTASKELGSVAILDNTNQSLRVKFTFLLYRFVGLAAMPLFLLYAAYRVAGDSKYGQRIAERFGFLPATPFGTKPNGIWLHAVSVGEVLSAISLVQEMRRRWPETAIWVSVATIAGRTLAEQRLSPLVQGVFFAPLDSVWILRRLLRLLRPAIFINLETELWPNRFRELKRIGAAVLQVNARISDKAWPSYQRLAWFWQPVLTHIDWMAVQSPLDAKRFQTLGYQGPLTDLGNLKFDFNPAAKPLADDLRALLEQWRDRPLWIAASTVGATGPGDIDEEDAVLDTFQTLGNSVRLLLAPRKPERFQTVADKLSARGLRFRIRTELSVGEGSILLLNTLGELSATFPYANVVFVGGSLCRWGGHNILEPAYFGKPILTGPFMQNFAAIQEKFREARAVHVVESSAELSSRLTSLLEDDEGSGARARQLAQSCQGVATRILDQAGQFLEASVPITPLSASTWTYPFTWLWKLGSAWPAKVRSLPATVISVGNLSMGGTGKTPTTLALASALLKRGKRVGILTRGYGRRSSAPLTLLPGEIASALQTGDEAQLYIAHGHLAIGIGSNRYEAGRRLLDRYEADVLLLDDGFQHKGLARDFNLVLIDASHPFPGGEVPPVGLLREPLSALRRADAFLLTRVEKGRSYAGLLARLPQGKPVFVAEESLRLSRPVEDENALAFCGLGNPAGFRLSLDRLGLSHLELAVFNDHHQYTRAEQQALRLRAHTLVTTAKDAAKWEQAEDLVILHQELILPPELLEKAFLAAERSERT